MTLLCLRPDGDWSWETGNLERDEEDIRGIFWGVRERETRGWERRAEEKYQMSRGCGGGNLTSSYLLHSSHYHGYHVWLVFF